MSLRELVTVYKGKIKIYENLHIFPDLNIEREITEELLSDYAVTNLEIKNETLIVSVTPITYLIT